MSKNLMMEKDFDIFFITCLLTLEDLKRYGQEQVPTTKTLSLSNMMSKCYNSPTLFTPLHSLAVDNSPLVIMSLML